MDDRVERLRLDVAMVARGLAETRARAQALIGGGGVTVNGKVITRPAEMVSAGDEVALAVAPMRYVSRGALKLVKALDTFDVRVQGRTAADVGASTGGFTEVLLERGARCVYAIDVGYGQLAWTLRTDPRVVVMERTNVRHLESLPEPIELTVIDVSFISLLLVLPVVRGWTVAGGECVCLIKPQFEAGRSEVGRKGVVRDPAIWRSVITRVLTAAGAGGWDVRGLTRSPITGPAGNVEFLAHLRLGSGQLPDLGPLIDAVCS